MTGCQCPANGSIVLLKFRVEGFLGQIWGHISYLNMTALLSTIFQSLADLGEGCGSSTPSFWSENVTEIGHFIQFVGLQLLSKPNG